MVYAGWVTLPSLLNMNSETIEMIEPTLTLRDMNAFAKNWLQGDNNKLRRVTIRRCRGFEWTNNEKYELLDGLDSEEWNEATNRREIFYEDETLVLRFLKKKNLLLLKICIQTRCMRIHVFFLE